AGRTGRRGERPGTAGHQPIGCRGRVLGKPRGGRESVCWHELGPRGPAQPLPSKARDRPDTQEWKPRVSLMSQRLNAAGDASPSFDDRDDDAPLPSFAEARSLKRELLEELRTRREEGTPARPEDLLPRWPTDPKSDADVASLL